MNEFANSFTHEQLLFTYAITAYLVYAAIWERDIFRTIFRISVAILFGLVLWFIGFMSVTLIHELWINI